MSKNIIKATNDRHDNYEFSSDLSKLYTTEGLKLLYEAIQEPLSRLIAATEEEPDAEPANAHLSVLSTLHAMLEERI